jgi:hypothetical protein
LGALSEKQVKIIEKALSFIQKYQDDYDDAILNGGDLKASLNELDKKFKGIFKFLHSNNIDKELFIQILFIGIANRRLEEENNPIES